MTPELFVTTYLPEAKKVESKTGFHYLIPLTQGALEGSWGDKAPGYNFFGIKASKSTPENKRQLITTTEYLKTATAPFPVVIKVIRQTNGLYKYTVKDWFMKYDSAEEAFDEHIKFFLKNPRYKEALKYKMNPDRFFEEIAKAGYATAPDYAKTLKQVKQSVIKRLPK